MRPLAISQALKERCVVLREDTTTSPVVVPMDVGHVLLEKKAFKEESKTEVSTSFQGFKSGYKKNKKRITVSVTFYSEAIVMHGFKANITMFSTSSIEIFDGNGSFVDGVTGIQFGTGRFLIMAACSP
ncbi:hypothetical protein HHK36_020928 [Tetracentron sinense]|uniref:Uncharacterized protein n=1 Tax=Tetracentron sinense TaxID=13715 RepID=A0A835D999_TETSI|nr:hypothetical protein HHK36_020928 [Tetracentron sinense]